MDWILIAWPTLLLLGLGLRMALRLCYGVRGPAINDPVYDFISLVSWVLISLGVIPGLVASIFGFFGRIICFFGLIILIIASVALVEVVVQYRAALRRSICSLLALYVERRMHFSASALLSTYTMRGLVGRAAHSLFAAMDAGLPLAAAVARNRQALPRNAIAYVGNGATIHADAASLKELARGEEREVATVSRDCVDRLAYLCCVLLVLIGVLTFVMIKIVPAFRDIFEEFDLDLPMMTELAVSLSVYFVTFLAVPTFLVVLVLFVSALVVGICLLCDVPILQGLGDRLFRGRRNADILRILAVAADQRQPFVPVLDRLAFVYPSSVAPGDWTEPPRAFRGGEMWQDALARQRLIRPPEAALLKSAEQTGNLAWALRSVADRRERRSIYRLTVALQVLYPIVIIFLGCVVGFFVVSLFIPIVALIQSLV